MGNKHSAEICKDDYIVIEELEVGVNNNVRESTGEYSGESDIEKDVFDYRKELERELASNTLKVDDAIKHLRVDGYYNSISNKDSRIAFLEDKLYETEIEYNTLYNEYMRLRIKMKKDD
tara:strand:- start:139 stop:495 length:357 start_codon:yes stop_codon:yes gene_type:complete